MKSRVFFFILFVFYFSINLIFADDSTVVTVGPGIRYHSVYKNSVGQIQHKNLRDRY